MIDIPKNLTALPLQQLRAIAGECRSECAEPSGGDALKAEETAKKRYPSLFTELRRRGQELANQETQPAVTDADRARIRASTPTAENLAALGLTSEIATGTEFDIAREARGNDSVPRWEDIFGALAEDAAKKNGVSAAEGEAQVRNRHPVLSRNNDAMRVKRLQAAELPTPGAGFSPKTGLHSPQITLATRQPGGGTRFPNRGKTGLGALAVVSNDANSDAVTDSWVRNFKPPLTDREHKLVEYAYGLLDRIEIAPGSIDAGNFVALGKLLDLPTVKEKLAGDVAASSLENSRATPLANSDVPFYAISDRTGWKFVN